ncbi:unnamed protein product [Lymnaea stagnalis]|uniref:ADP-ribosylation factor-like protein 13B n=1 Tax=Lymnaea stagnalis TaxID=6523 RepID=A0AAV2I8S0_LYMST
MGNCVSQLKKKKEPNRAITLAIVGIDNAGKTTLSCVLAGEQIDPDIAPTVGFRNAKFINSNFDIILFDVGGGKNIRPIWKTYFGEVFGIMYVVDSSSRDRLLEAKEVFKETLEHPQVSGKPVLILANKVDKEDHLKELDLVNGLDLEKTVNDNKCPSKLVMVSALKGVGTKMDNEIQEGLTWLLGNIGTNWSTLEPRIQEDMRQAKEKRDKEREERRARVKKQKEEREKAEELERSALGLEKKEESEEEDIVDGNPFKALDLDKLKKKEQLMKEEKRLKEKRKTHGDDSNLRTADETPGSLMSSQRLDMTRFDLGDTRVLHMDGNETKPSAINFLSRNNRGPALPPLEPLNSRSQEKLVVEKKKRKKKKLTEYNLTFNDDGNHGDDITSRLTLQPPKSGLWSREIEVHDLTPRIAKPKVTKVVKGKRIDEEEDEINSYPDIESRHMQLYNDLDDREKTALKPLKFDDSTLPNKAKNEINFKKGFETFPRDLEREDSVYRRTLKHVNPPNLHSFDEEKDEITERVDGDDKDFHNVLASKNSKGKNSKQLTKERDHRIQESDEENDTYELHNALKDTLRFPRSPRDEEAPRDFQQEIRELQQRHLSGLTKGSHNGYHKNMPTEEDEKIYRKGKQDLSRGKLSPVPIKEERSLKGETSDRSETKRKKKRNLLRSNKLAPSDDEDADSAFSEKFTSPRMVQERGSRNSSDNETPVKKSSSKLTQFHRNISHDSDFGAKWGLAEDLPAVDNDYNVRRFPNFDDSDAGDIVY